MSKSLMTNNGSLFLCSAQPSMALPTAVDPLAPQGCASVSSLTRRHPNTHTHTHTHTATSCTCHIGSQAAMTSRRTDQSNDGARRLLIFSFLGFRSLSSPDLCGSSQETSPASPNDGRRSRRRFLHEVSFFLGFASGV